MTEVERCIYYVELSKLRFNQFFLSFGKCDRIAVFQEAVTCLSPTGSKASNGSKTTLKDVFLNGQKQLVQLETLLYEAFTESCKSGTPIDAEEIGHKITEICLFKASVLQRNVSFAEPLFALEYPKSIYNHREKENMISKISFEKLASNFKSEVDDHLRDDFVVCTLNINGNVLYLSRLEKGENLLYKLPLGRIAIRDGCINGSGMNFQDTMDEFARIMSINRETTTNAKYCTTSSEKKAWLSTRKQLDKSLENLLENIENSWLSGFRGLLSDKIILKCHVFDNFRARTEKMITGYLRRCFNSKTAGIELDDALCKTILRLGTDPQFEDLEDILYYILDCYQLKGVLIEYDELNIEDVRL